ncbi:MAG: (Fe-S)-binding protein [Deltaproteobacteria bacterium]|nr:MAG: (Fe-S)-binding protein [Deltaproteobacteria bacterium]
MEALQVQKVKDEIKETFKKVNLNECLTCGTCSSGCPVTGIPGVEGLDTRKVIRMLAYGMVDEVVDSKFPWVCTQCGRCNIACPMKIDINYLMKKMKSLRDRDKVPGVLHKGTLQVLKSGNNLGIPKDDYLENMIDIGREWAGEEGEELALEGFEGFKTPIDVVGAEYLFFPNSKEVGVDYEDMQWWWKIFHNSGCTWTMPSEGWESVDWGLFTGNDEASKKIAQYKVDNAKKLKVKYIIAPDCGGGSLGFRINYENYFKEELNKAGIELVYLYDVLIRFIKEGRIKVDKSRHPDPVTYHDPCKHGRELERLYGKPYYDEARWILDQCCESFIEAYPCKINNYCCGGGGGAWAGPYNDEKIAYGRMKAQQYSEAKAKGAKVIVTSCSNCRDMFMKAIVPHYKLDMEVKYIWQVVAEAMVL